MHKIKAIFRTIRKKAFKVIRLLRINDLLYRVLYPFKSHIIEPDYENSMNYLMSQNKMADTEIFRNNELNEIKYDLKIIVPAYNVEKYLDDCVQSIISQETKYSFIVVLVDDGSTDETRNIVDKYTSSKLVQVAHQENQGQASARNIALKTIDSKYLCFVDADDLMAPGFIELFLSEIINEEADIIEGGCNYLSEGGVFIHHHYSHKIVTSSHTRLTGFPWGKIYSTQLFNNSVCPQGYWFEDTILRLNIFQHAKKVVLLPQMGYYYRYNPNGSTAQSRNNYTKVLDTVWITKLLVDSRKLLHIDVNTTYFEDVLYQIIVNWKRTAHLTEEIQMAIFQVAVKLINSIDNETDNKPHRFKMLYNAIISHDYGAYRLYMLTH